MAKRGEEYDWLNDPFDEKKCAEEMKSARMSTGSKAAVGIGCVVVFALVVFLVVLGGSFLLSPVGA